MPKYAEHTKVSTGQSRMEIERCCERYGATGFMFGWKGTQAVIAFEMNNRQIRFNLPLPEKNSPEFTETPSRGWKRTPEQAYQAWEKACRQRWRALGLCIKSKFEAIECGITSFDSEFLAHFLTENGQTVGERIIPQLDSNVKTTLELPE